MRYFVRLLSWSDRKLSRLAIIMMMIIRAITIMVQQVFSILLWQSSILLNHANLPFLFHTYACSVFITTMNLCCSNWINQWWMYLLSSEIHENHKFSIGKESVDYCLLCYSICGLVLKTHNQWPKIIIFATRDQHFESYNYCSRMNGFICSSVIILLVFFSLINIAQVNIFSSIFPVFTTFLFSSISERH